MTAASPDDLAIASATTADIPQLAELNRRLMADEAHPYPLSIEALHERMARWVAGEYRVLLFRHGGQVCGYAVWRVEEEGVHVRHFFICRDQRRRGIGRAAFARMRREVFPTDQPIHLDAAVWNTDAIGFWRALGFRDFSLTLELQPDAAVA